LNRGARQGVRSVRRDERAVPWDDLDRRAAPQKLM